MRVAHLVGGPADGQVRAVEDGAALVVERMESRFGIVILRQRGEYRPMAGESKLWSFGGWYDLPPTEAP